MNRSHLLTLSMMLLGCSSVESADETSSSLREFPNDPSSHVYQHYYAMNRRQTLSYVLNKKAQYSHLNSYIEISLQEAFAILEGFVDPSDPDVDFSNHIHNFQTAESCRRLLPDVDWFHLVGLLHDVGKLLYIFDEPTWAIVGDTFVVGHPFDARCVYSEFFHENPDYHNPTQYEKKCGFDNVHLSWGHDEYLYQVLKHNETSLPEEALYIIRYHSFYPWHDQGAYADLASKRDYELLEWLKLFNSCDLYSKVDDIINYEDIKPYYDQLIAKYLPAKIRFYKPPHITVNLG